MSTDREPRYYFYKNSRGPLTSSVDNVLASRLGRATRAAAAASAGDQIDTGLALLRALREAGFEVRYVSEPDR